MIAGLFIVVGGLILVVVAMYLGTLWLRLVILVVTLAITALVELLINGGWATAGGAVLVGTLLPLTLGLVAWRASRRTVPLVSVFELVAVDRLRDVESHLDFVYQMRASELTSRLSAVLGAALGAVASIIVALVTTPNVSAAVVAALALLILAGCGWVAILQRQTAALRGECLDAKRLARHLGA